MGWLQTKLTKKKHRLRKLPLHVDFETTSLKPLNPKPLLVMVTEVSGPMRRIARLRLPALAESGFRSSSLLKAYSLW